MLSFLIAKPPFLKSWNKKTLQIVLIALSFFGLAAAATGGYFYYRYSHLEKNPAEIAQEEVQRIVERVGRHIVLPEGEDPTIATVTDPEQLKIQPFFAKAKAGDKVLIYPKAQKAILYSVRDDKVVEIAPFTAEKR